MLRYLRILPERLKRVTSGGKFINEIDGLRFIAIMPVLVQHMTERFERNTTINFSASPEEHFLSFLAARGFLGVYIFFVISGFILALPFAAHYLQQKKEIKLKDYFWRRITRLEPPYIIWITVFFILFLIAKGQSFLEYLPHYLANITYTHSLIYNEWSPFNPPTWTLEIEIQFYILAPLLALLFFKIRNKILRRTVNGLAILTLILLQQYFQLYTNPYSFTILGHLHYFLIGFFLADIYLEDWKGNTDKSIFYDLTAISSLVCLIFVWSWDYELSSRLLVVTALFCFFFSAFKSNYVNRFICNRWITAIGGMCYTIYLIHLPLAEFLISFTKNIKLSALYSVNLFTQLAIFIPFVLVISTISFILFEKPFMDKNWPAIYLNKFKSSIKKH